MPSCLGTVITLLSFRYVHITAADARLRSQASPVGICSVHDAQGQVCSPSTWFFLCQYHSSNAVYAYFICVIPTLYYTAFEGIFKYVTSKTIPAHLLCLLHHPCIVFICTSSSGHLSHLHFILTFVLCLLFHPCIYLICLFSSLRSFYLCFAMLASVLSLLQGPCSHFISINHPCVSVICVSLICTSPSLLAFYFRFTLPAFVLSPSPPQHSVYFGFTTFRFFLSLLHHSCNRFSFCFTISTFVSLLFCHHNFRVKDRTEIWALSN